MAHSHLDATQISLLQDCASRSMSTAALQGTGTRLAMATSAAAGYFFLVKPSVDVAAQVPMSFEVMSIEPLIPLSMQIAQPQKSSTLVKRGTESAIAAVNIVSEPFSGKGLPFCDDCVSHVAPLPCEQTTERAKTLVKRGSENALAAARLMTEPFGKDGSNVLWPPLGP